MIQATLQGRLHQTAVFFLALSWLMLAGPAHAEPWSIYQDVDQGELTGLYPCLEISRDDAPDAPALHITYYDRERAAIRYAKIKDAVVVARWELPPGETAGVYSSLGVDPAGGVHIAYYDPAGGDLKKAFFVDPAEPAAVDIIDAEGDVGLYNSLAVDDDGTVHISYYDSTNGDLKYYNGRTGMIFVVASPGDAGRYTSIAVHGGAGKRIYISYYDSTEDMLKCAYSSDDGASWQTEPVDGRTVMHSSLVIDSTGQPHIAYYEAQLKALKYAVRTENGQGPSWRSFYVATGILDFLQLFFGITDEGAFCSLKLDSQDRPHISYYNAVLGQVEYAHFNGLRWRRETPYTDTFSGPYNCMALDSQERPYIALFTTEDRYRLSEQ